MRRKATLGFPLLASLLLIMTTSAFLYIQRLASRREIYRNHTLSVNLNGEWDDFAIALKTGKEVALERAPIQLLTFLADVKNKIIIGNGPNVTVGEMEVIDVITDLYTHTPSNLRKRALKQEQLVPDESSQGWKSDAHKNLPGFKELYRRFPHAKWYIMIDDDTYLLKANLALMLSKYDHQIPHYFGAATSFVGCDGIEYKYLILGVYDFRMSPKFAQGGAGIVISNAAMKLLNQNIDHCIIKYKSCWAGDVRTALCLRDVGIHLENFPGFHKDPPNERFSFSKPCDIPLTFHHLLATHIQKLADLEKSKKALKDSFPTMADVYHLFIKPEQLIRKHTDRIGHDLYVGEATSHLDCASKCEYIQECTSFVYDGSQCWIKNGIPPLATSKEEFYSGVMESHYKCSR